MPLGQGSEDPNRRQNRVSFTGAGDGAGSRSASYAVALAGSPQRRGSERQGSARSRANSGSLSRLPSAKGRLSRQASAISPALSRAVSGVLSEPDSDGEEQGWAAQVARWKLSVVKEGILEAEPQAARARVPQAQCGVSLWWLQQFLGNMQDSAALSSFMTTTEQLVSKIIIPLTRASPTARCRLYDLVPAQHVGRPTYYVIHTWGDSLDHVVSNICAHLAPPPLPGMPPLKMHEDDLRSTFVWLDAVAISQHFNAALIKAGPDLASVRDALAAAEKGSLVVLDPSMALLDRCWCMYEIWASVYYGDCLRLEVVFPTAMSLEEMCDFQARCQAMDLTKGISTRPMDKQRIVAEVKHCVGLKRMSQLLPDALMRSARHGLRWGGGLARKAMYCALLLRSGEYAQVQSVLHSIPEIHDDEKVLQDIRDVFKNYDADGSGELSTHEFVDVLAVAGFSEEEAKDIFSKVDVDQGGSVSMIEFEQWWIESQRQESTRYAHKVELTAQALLTNIESMVAVLERSGLRQYSPFYKAELARLSQPKALARSRPLPFAPVKGDWRTASEQCAWKINAGDHRGAARMMHGLLMWNGDLLPKAPEQLVVPEPGAPSEKAMEVLAEFFEVFAHCLARVPATERQAEYFKRAGRDLRDRLEEMAKAELEADDDMPIRIAKQPKSKRAPRKAKLFPGRGDMEREQIVSSMVRLKYGTHTLLSSKLIVEAEKSLSQWMAAQKSSQGKGQQDNREAVREFSRAYMVTQVDDIARIKAGGGLGSGPATGTNPTLAGPLSPGRGGQVSWGAGTGGEGSGVKLPLLGSPGSLKTRQGKAGDPDAPLSRSASVPVLGELVAAQAAALGAASNGTNGALPSYRRASAADAALGAGGGAQGASGGLPRIGEASARP